MYIRTGIFYITFCFDVSRDYHTAHVYEGREEIEIHYGTRGDSDQTELSSGSRARYTYFILRVHLMYVGVAWLVPV